MAFSPLATTHQHRRWHANQMINPVQYILAQWSMWRMEKRAIWMARIVWMWLRVVSRTWSTQNTWRISGTRNEVYGEELVNWLPTQKRYVHWESWWVSSVSAGKILKALSHWLSNYYYWHRLPFFIMYVISAYCANCNISYEWRSGITWLGYINRLVPIKKK